MKNCLHYSPPEKETAKESGPGTNSAIPKSAKNKNAKIYQPVNKPVVRCDSQPSVAEQVGLSGPPTAPLPSFSPPPTATPAHNPPPVTPSPMEVSFSSPDPTPRPSLKRSRSSPTLSSPPPSSSNPNPFLNHVPSFSTLCNTPLSNSFSILNSLIPSTSFSSLPPVSDPLIPPHSPNFLATKDFPGSGDPPVLSL